MRKTQADRALEELQTKRVQMNARHDAERVAMDMAEDLIRASLARTPRRTRKSKPTPVAERMPA